jgi:ABC-type transport system substrate-binding protein
MNGRTSSSLRIPVGSINHQFDNDDPHAVHGRGGRSGTYLLLALCYDTLAGPSHSASSDGILTQDVTRMRPRLAESFEELTDGSWVVRLRPGIKSHAGNELTAESIRWAFEKAFALVTLGSWRWGQIAGVPDAEHVEPTDRHTLRFRLRKPNPYLPAFFFSSTPMIVDASEVASHASPSDPWAVGWLDEHVAGFGAFSLEDATEERMLFRARADYWAGKPPVSDILVDLIESRAEALDLLDKDDPVLLLGLSCDEMSQLKRRTDTRLIGTWAGHTSLEMGYHRPPFDDIRVRHALSFATPYNEVVQKGFLGFARSWRTPMKNYTPWATDRFWKYETSLERARELLADAGYAGGFQTWLYTPQRRDLLRVAEILKAAYARVGIEIELRDTGLAPAGWVPPLHLRAECAHNMTEPLYDLAHDYAAINPIIPAPGGHVGAPNWLPRYIGSRTLEDSYRAALLAETKEEREQRCVTLQREIIDFAPCVFLAENMQFHAASAACDPWVADLDNNLMQRTLWQVSNSNYLSPIRQPKLQRA